MYDEKYNENVNPILIQFIRSFRKLFEVFCNDDENYITDFNKIVI